MEEKYIPLENSEGNWFEGLKIETGSIGENLGSLETRICEGENPWYLKNPDPKCADQVFLPQKPTEWLSE